MSAVKDGNPAGSTKSQTTNSQQANNPSQTPQASTTVSQQSSNQQERVLITGDDILIEYVERLMNEIKNVTDNDLKPTWKS